MKKLSKWLAVAVMAAMVAVAAFGCSSTVRLEGAYSYTNYGNTYGAKVLVTLHGNKISEVLMLNANDWVVATGPSVWTDETTRNKYINNESHMLKAYQGHTVDEVLSWTVTTDTIGQPLSIDDAADPYVLCSGATQSSGRLLLAIQDALKKVADNTK